MSMTGVASLRCRVSDTCVRGFGSERAREIHERDDHQGPPPAPPEGDRRFRERQIAAASDVPPSPKEAEMPVSKCPVEGCTKEAHHRGRHIGGGTLAGVKADRPPDPRPKPKPRPRKKTKRAAPRRSSASIERATGRRPNPSGNGAQPMVTHDIVLAAPDGALLLSILEAHPLEGTVGELSELDLFVVGLVARIRGKA